MNNKRDILSSYIIGPFIKAWNLFFDVQLPEKFTENIDVDESCLLYFIPVVGFVIGLIAYVIAWFFYFVGGTLVASVISPILILIFIELLTHSRDSSNLVEFLASRFAFYNKAPGDEVEHKQNNFMFYYIFAGIFVLRIFCFGMIIYFHHFGWLIIVYILSFAVEGYLAADNQNMFREELIHAGTKSGLKLTIVTFVLCIIFGGVYFPRMLVAFIVTAFIAYYIKNKLLNKDMLNGVNIGIIGKTIEIILLILGLLYKLRF